MTAGTQQDHSETGAQVATRGRHIKAHLAGALAMLAGLCLLAGLVFPYFPSASPLGPVARIFDSLAPWLLALGLGLALVPALLGARWLAAFLAVVAISGAGHLAWTHRALSLPTLPDAQADMRILFFNALFENAAFSYRIVEAALEEEPDVIVFAEGAAIYPALRLLKADYEFVSPCTFEACEILVATRKTPKRFWRLSLNPVWLNRYTVAELQGPDGNSFFVTGSQIVKPWFSGVTEPEMERLIAQFNWLPGPVIAVGDFNAAPWSRPMRSLMERTGMRALRRPIGTWPAKARGLGVPIDQILVRDGARVVRIIPFGDALNSNHRGFVADIALP